MTRVSGENPKNLGKTINTELNEEGVFIHPDGKTIYFSSEAHTSMGGYDIFRSRLENGKWTEPVNLGWPINGPGDDVFFVVNANGRHGYYASAKKGGVGSQDIYMITMLGPEKPVMYNTEDQLLAGVSTPVLDVAPEPKVEISANQLTLFKGTMTSEASGQPIDAKILITDNEAGVLITESESNPKTGKFLITLPSGKNYGIAVEAEGFLFHSENFDLPEGGDYQIVNKDIKLKKVEVGKKIVLRNIFYEFNKATLTPESKTELANLVQLLTENPTLRVELGAHTDSKGSDTYNQSLSEKRAQSVVDYLAQAGIPSDRLVAKGYGEAQPIADNGTEEGRKENRRTEFKVLGL
jgi:outer membrane protein OmpA-like peptidoglycan-associated protein